MGRQFEKQPRKRYTETDRQIDRQTDRQTTDKQTVRQTDNRRGQEAVSHSVSGGVWLIVSVQVGRLYSGVGLGRNFTKEDRYQQFHTLNQKIRSNMDSYMKAPRLVHSLRCTHNRLSLINRLLVSLLHMTVSLTVCCFAICMDSQLQIRHHRSEYRQRDRVPEARHTAWRSDKSNFQIVRHVIWNAD